TNHRVKLIARSGVQNITAFRLELLTDPNLPRGGPGRSEKGICALTEFELETVAPDAPEKPKKIKIAKATADIGTPETEASDDPKKSKKTGPIEFAIDGKDETAWGIDAGPGLRNQPHNAVFEAETPVSNPAGTLLNFYL